MGACKSDFLNVLGERGFIHQATDMEGLDALLASAPQTAYIGFDCTAPSLHIGSLVQIMMLRWFQKCGHTAIALMGGGTTKVGDPSGRDESRRLLSDSDIDTNMASIKTCFERFLSFDGSGNNALMINNNDWLSGLGYIELLRDVGPHFTINRMLGFDSVKLRLDREQPLTFLEFNYMILQAYDFMELNRMNGCRIQMGGSDQWGNIVNGMELARRMDGAALFGLTSPLITTSDGAKMGKTAKGAVWLNEEQLSSYDYWQFWRNTQDADVGRFLKLFTEMPLAEIKKLEVLEGAELNEAKKTLADLATALCRGTQAAVSASDTARKTFELKSAGADLPTYTVSKDELNEGFSLVDALVRTELCKSKKEARRLAEQGGAKIEGTSCSKDRLITIGDYSAPNSALKLSAGKKKHALLLIAD
jgi:tyrosyl-tRNA synthetase